MMNVQPQAAAPPQQGAQGVQQPFHSASLYVGDLDPSVSESTLFEIFNAVGPVASIRVCRDTVTRRSLGYAYVNFHNMADAERALDTMNFTVINQTKACRIMWSQRDPTLRRTGVGNIFVKNLDPTVDNKALYDTFSLFGNILSCKVATDEADSSKGYGYVHYETAEAANEAISKIDGMLIAGKQVHVGHFVRRNDRASQTDWTNVYVKNLPKTWTEEKLKEVFTRYGTVTSCKISTGAAASDEASEEKDKDNKDGKTESKGFGFVNFEEHEAAVKAVEAHKRPESAAKEDGETEEGGEEKKEGEDGEEKEGEGEKEGDKKEKEEAKKEEDKEEKTEEDQGDQLEREIKELVVCRAQKKSERDRELRAKYETIRNERLSKYQGVNLYVKNLENDITEDQVREAFSAHGTVTSARIMKDSTSGQSKGFGFICFSAPEEATKAVQEMNNRMMNGKPIYVALAQRKEVRRAQLEAQYQQRTMPGGPRGPMGMPQAGLYGAMPYMMGQPGMALQRPQPGGYPMMPQMMPRGPAVRGLMPPAYGGRGSYPMPAYAAMGQAQMPGGVGGVQQQRRQGGNSQRPRTGGQQGQQGGPGGPQQGGPQGGGRGQGGAPRGAKGGPQQQGGPRGVQQNQGGFQYTQQVRNQPAPQGGQPGQQGQQGQAPPASAGGAAAAQEVLTPAALAAASPEKQKNMLGERLYPLIHEVEPELAGKITGMLLEMDNSELLHLLESPDSLKGKILEALRVLQEHAGAAES